MTSDQADEPTMYRQEVAQRILSAYNILPHEEEAKNSLISNAVDFLRTLQDEIEENPLSVNGLRLVGFSTVNHMNQTESVSNALARIVADFVDRAGSPPYVDAQYRTLAETLHSAVLPENIESTLSLVELVETIPDSLRAILDRPNRQGRRIFDSPKGREG